MDTTDEKLHRVKKMMDDWQPRHARIETATAHLVCMIEEVGEAIDASDDPNEMMRELADVIIAANMVALTLETRTLSPILLPAISLPDSTLERLLQLASAAAKTASTWRKLSGMRHRASLYPATYDDMLNCLRITVGWAYSVSPNKAVPLTEVLDVILARGRGLSTREEAVVEARGASF